MADKTILTILRRLVHAYPEKILEQGTLKVYQEQLSDIPLALLERAADQHIQSSSFFPHIADLRKAAQQISGTLQFTSLPTFQVDALEYRSIQLEKEYFQQGKFDPLHWDQLARLLEHAGRDFRADELRRKAGAIQESMSAAQRGETYPPVEVRLRYARFGSKE